jgi:hypothetical protein
LNNCLATWDLADIFSEAVLALCCEPCRSAENMPVCLLLVCRLGVNMRSGLEVNVVYADEHLIELRVHASNGEFAGQASVYALNESPARLAEALRGFPAHAGDVREFHLGKFDKGVGGDGGVELRFYCADAAGHGAVDVRIETMNHRGQGLRSWAASFGIRIEAAAVDAFVEQLSRLSATVGDRAELAAAA